MKLYVLRIDERNRYVGTQAEAKALHREIGAPWQDIEVPIDKAGLIAFLNAHDRGAAPEAAQPAGPQTDAPIAAPAAGTSLTLTDVEEFVQSADHPQLSSITENCIYRIRELLAAAEPGAGTRAMSPEHPK